jgi:cobalt transporter subunit CbtB
MNSASTSAASVGFAKWPAVLALAFGFLLIYGAGLSFPSALHNATHDTRHAFGLPCH